MTTIGLSANDQLLAVTLNPKIASGNQNTVTLHVDFSEDWSRFGKSAVFFTSNDTNTIYEKVLTSGECIVPAEVMSKDGILYIGVRGVNYQNNEVKTTSLVKYKILEGSPSGTGTEVEPTPDVYQQLLTAYGMTDSAIAKEVVDRKAEIAVERARIDNLSTLKEGSTTGDAELLDIRVKADGTTATSAGNAVREQVSELKSDLITLEQYGYPMASISEAVNVWGNSNLDKFVPEHSITENKLAIDVINKINEVDNSIVLNVLKLGAKNDGSADCSDIINQYGQTNSLYFPAGKYLVTKPVNVRHSIIGDGNVLAKVVSCETSSIILDFEQELSNLKNTGAFVIEGNSNVRNINFYINGVCNGVEMPSSGTKYMENVTIEGAKSYGLMIGGEHSRSSVLHGVVVMAEDGYNNVIGINIAGTDNECENLHLFGCHIGIKYGGTLRISNSHIYTGKEVLARYTDSVGLYAVSQSYTVAQNCCVDTIKFPFWLRGNSMLSATNTILWNDTNDETTGGRLVMMENGNNKAVFKGGFVYLGNPFNYNQLLYCEHNDLISVDGLIMIIPKEESGTVYEGPLPATINGYKKDYRLLVGDNSGKYVLIARTTNGENFSECKFIVQTQNGLTCNIRVKKNLNTDIVEVDNSNFDIRYRNVNGHILIYVKANTDYGIITVTEIYNTTSMGLVNFDYITYYLEPWKPEVIINSTGLIGAIYTSNNTDDVIMPNLNSAITTVTGKVVKSGSIAYVSVEIVTNKQIDEWTDILTGLPAPAINVNYEISNSSGSYATFMNANTNFLQTRVSIPAGTYTINYSYVIK